MVRQLPARIDRPLRADQAGWAFPAVDRTLSLADRSVALVADLLAAMDPGDPLSRPAGAHDGDGGDMLCSSRPDHRPFLADCRSNRQLGILILLGEIKKRLVRRVERFLISEFNSFSNYRI